MEVLATQSRQPWVLECKCSCELQNTEHPRPIVSFLMALCPVQSELNLHFSPDSTEVFLLSAGGHSQPTLQASTPFPLQGWNPVCFSLSRSVSNLLSTNSSV